MPHTQIVPRSHWETYLKAVSERHLEQPLTLSQERPSNPSRMIADGLYFMGASLEGGHQPALIIHMSRLGQPDRHMSHRIANPVLLMREEDARHQIDRIVVQGPDHERIVLHFDCDAQSPGPRRLAAQLDRDACDHPRCPLPAA